MYSAGTNVSDARKALKIKGFPGIEHVRGSATVIVSDEEIKVSGHSSIIYSIPLSSLYKVRA